MLAVARAESRPVTGRLVLADIETGGTRLHPVELDEAEALADLEGRIRYPARGVLRGTRPRRGEARGGRVAGLPVRDLPSRPARDGRGGGAGRRAGRAPPRRGADRHRQDGGGPPPSPPRRAHDRAAALRPDGEDDAAGDVREDARRRSTRTRSGRSASARRSGCARTTSSSATRSTAASRRTTPPRWRPRACSTGSSSRGATSTRTRSSRRRAAEEVCPFEVSLEIAERADVVIGDYNYVFDPVVALSGAKDPDALAQSYLLVDEAHNLVDRGRGYYSPELSDAALAALADRISSFPAQNAWDGSEAARRLRQLVADAAASLPEGTDAGLVPLDDVRLDDLRLDLEALLVRHLAHLRGGGERVPDDPLLDLYFTFAAFHDTSKLAVSRGRGRALPTRPSTSSAPARPPGLGSRSSARTRPASSGRF